MNISVPLYFACLLFEKEVSKNQAASKFQGMQSLLMFKAQNVGHLILEDIFNVKKKMLLVTHRSVEMYSASEEQSTAYFIRQVAMK
jgi:hypothetical protein